MAAHAPKVCLPGYSGKHLHRLRFSPFDPRRISSVSTSLRQGHTTQRGLAFGPFMLGSVPWTSNHGYGDELLRSWRMRGHMQSVVVIGAGKIGTTVAGLLASAGYRVSLTDRSQA